jgi:hypothetical protein
MCDVGELKSPNILFLKGVYFRNCPDVSDMFDDRLTEMAAFDPEHPVDTISAPITYDKIPHLFYSIDTWIKSTNLKCWGCECPFRWMPFFTPTSITSSGTMPDEYMPIKPIGNFCSIPCMGDWVNVHIPKEKRWEKLEQIKLLYKIMAGTKLDTIPKGVDKTSMVHFGGSLTIAEYQARIKLISSQVGIKFPSQMFTEHVTPEDTKLTMRDVMM